MATHKEQDFALPHQLFSFSSEDEVLENCRDFTAEALDPGLHAVNEWQQRVTNNFYIQWEHT